MRPLVVIPKPARVVCVPGRIAPRAHQVFERNGERLVFDWMMDVSTGLPVLRGVNMATGLVKWFAPDEAALAEATEEEEG